MLPPATVAVSVIGASTVVDEFEFKLDGLNVSVVVLAGRLSDEVAGGAADGLTHTSMTSVMACSLRLLLG